VSGVNTRFDVPHSRFNQVDAEQFQAAGLKVLVQSEEAGVHLAVSEDGFRIVLSQGHPEYDAISLLKEYKRELGRYIQGELQDYPPFPENYFSLQSLALLEEYQDRVMQARAAGAAAPAFPEHHLVARLDNTWHDSAEAVINNWIGKVYQITDIDRRLPFRPGIDPANPLGL
jgi:homoserine O-succinyltransferase